jgi:putative ABC transport system permease protein
LNIFDLVVLSLRTLAKHKLRSSLTVLGVIIGIAAVTTMVSIGEGAGELVRNEFRAFGANVLVIFPARNRANGVQQGNVATLTAQDAAALPEECSAVAAASPIVGVGRNQIVGGDENWEPQQMSGVGPDYPLVRNWRVVSGQFFGEREVAGASKVCVIGHTVAVHLFSDVDPVGQQIRIKSIPFTVIGVLGTKGADLVGDDQDDLVLMPYTTARKRLQSSAFSNIDVILASARSEAESPLAQQQIRELLAERHRIPPGSPPDIELRNTAEVAAVLNGITATLTAMLSAVAAISLVVGGVGIMNIMLVSVTERTREIGLRMALGARPTDILRQFLVEAVVLSSLGGVFGILTGVGASYLITLAINALLPGATKWPFIVSVPATIVALLFAAAVGIFFGYYPARRASRLDPIEALRYD